MRKAERRTRRKKTIRKKISGTGEKPRMCIHKSNRNIYVQIINDVEGKTLCGLSTRSRTVRDRFSTFSTKNTGAAVILGEEIAGMALPKGIKKVVFDRSGYGYHGVVKIFADTAREKGLDF
ncbi:MAG: 50S ribosomal protein L18 [Candidatus Omnitrophica bacterium]|nr:50S ribosomal protein L18 [Candidatus Omnitrophota bacterium]